MISNTGLVTRELTDADRSLALRFKCGNIFIDGFIRSSLAFDVGFGKTYVWLSVSKLQDEQDCRSMYLALDIEE